MKKELLLISNLRKEGRAQLTKVSRETNIPVSTLFDLLKKVDMQHTCIPDFKRYGFQVRATITIKVDIVDKDRIREYLLNHPNLNSIWKINNGYDYMIEVIFKEMNELEAFADKLEKNFTLKAKNIYYIIEDISREQFMNNPKSLQYVVPLN